MSDQPAKYAKSAKDAKDELDKMKITLDALEEMMLGFKNSLKDQFPDAFDEVESKK